MFKKLTRENLDEFTQWTDENGGATFLNDPKINTSLLYILKIKNV